MFWKFVVALAVFGGSVFLKVPVWAEKAETYDLYSWEIGTRWEYALLTGAQSAASAEEIKRAGVLRNEGQLKEKFLHMEEGKTVNWRQKAENGMVYPPKATIQALQDYAKALGIKLVLASPEGRADKP